MKNCPNCGRYLPDTATECEQCGYALTASDPKAGDPAVNAAPVPLYASPTGFDVREAPKPVKRGPSRKVWIAMICAAVVLVVTGILVFGLGKGRTTGNVLKSKTETKWSESNGKEEERTTILYGFDERGLLTSMTLTAITPDEGTRTGKADIAYQFDKHNNPTTLKITVMISDEVIERLDFHFGNQYEGSELTRVDITADQTGDVDFFLGQFTPYTGYRNALLVTESSEVQLQNGKTVHSRQTVGEASIFEVTNEYKDDTLIWTIQRNIIEGEEKFYRVMKYDNNGRITSQTYRADGETSTLIITYEETSDPHGRKCLVPMTKASDEETATVDEGIYFYTNAEGAVIEQVTESSAYSQIIRYDDKRRVVFYQTKNQIGEGSVSCSETTNEYR